MKDADPTLAYHAFPRINLRYTDSGGAILRTAQVVPRYLLVNADELVLLIHGYNNDRDTALRSYYEFLKNLGDPWRKLAAGLFWPGDGISSTGKQRQPGFLSRMCGTATYSWQPFRAQQAANYLNELLMTTNRARGNIARLLGHTVRPLTLNIVAHSIGCRLTLELIRLLQGLISSDQLRVRSVTLMAAAVPLYHVEERGLLESALQTAETTRVLWSRADVTLKYWFRLGQSLERHVSRGFLLSSRQALGRSGLSLPPRVNSEETQLNHSDYWKSSLAAKRVREDLNKRVGVSATSEPLVSRALPFRRLGERHIRVAPNS
ncbi:alpha/beta hydrolase [Sphingomonas aerolata]|uniref:alpha/beta hydrolase n=1 Tax=Sphingomonas aerolata TaxID=185951 RepID=UPI003364C5A2